MIAYAVMYDNEILSDKVFLKEKDAKKILQNYIVDHPKFRDGYHIGVFNLERAKEITD